MVRVVSFAKFVLLPVTVVSITLIAFIEAYFPFVPLIDTKFSSRFDLRGFDSIAAGDSINAVFSKLGDPIWKIGCGGCWEEEHYLVDAVVTVPATRTCTTRCEASRQRWQFSDDGACSWWDFAWKEYSLEFDEGVVTRKVEVWHYD